MDEPVCDNPVGDPDLRGDYHHPRAGTLSDSQGGGHRRAGIFHRHGPKLLQWEKGETKYTLRLLPIGGYVAMEGEDEESDNERAFCNKKPLQKILVVAAGATMNLILGFLIMLAIVCSRPVVSSTQISYFDPSALSSEKLQLGDEILEINGYRTNTANDLVYAFVDVGTDPVQMKVRRDGEVIELTDVPFAYEEIEGQTIVKLDFKVQGLEKTPLRVLEESWHMTTGVVKQVWVSFGKLITGQFEMNQLSGPGRRHPDDRGGRLHPRLFQHLFDDGVHHHQHRRL